MECGNSCMGGVDLMTNVGEIVLDTKVLDRIAKNLDKDADQIVHGLALEVEGYAKIFAPVDTGALKSSINTKREKEKVYRVEDGVEYGIYQELGTSKMAAQPFMMPAVERIRKFIAKRFQGLIK